MIKRIITFIALSIFSISAIFADLYKPHRIFEIGIDGDIAAANSSVALKDILTKNLVIDLPKISSEMPDDGFKFSLFNKENFFMNLNVSSRFRFGLFTSIEASSNMNISKDLFDLLGDGFSVGDSKTVDVKGQGDVFMSIGASFQTIIKNYGVKITPAYVVPLVYVPSTTASGTLKTDSSGLIKMEAEANLDIYTAIDMEKFMENGKNFSDLELNAANILSNGGFDLTLEVERNWLHGLNAGAYIRIPMIPGTLKYKMSTRVYASIYETNALGYIRGSEEHGKDYGHDDFSYSSANYKVFRPFKFGFNASYAPFGEWFKIQPLLGFGLRNPYSSDIVFYPEYALDLIVCDPLQIVNFSVGTAYQEQIFIQRMRLGFNFRVLEIYTQIGLCGTNLKASFERNGYNASIGLRLGY